MHTEIWGVSMKAARELSSPATCTLILFSDMIFLVVLVLADGFSILIFFVFI